MQPSGLDRQAQRLARTKQMELTVELVQRRRAHAIRQRPPRLLGIRLKHVPGVRHGNSEPEALYCSPITSTPAGGLK